MAKLNGPFDLTGGVGGFVVYRLPGVDKPVMRQIGEVSKEKRRKHPSYARVRENQAEFGGRGTATAWIRTAMSGQLALPNFACACKLHPVLRRLQEMDTAGRRGQRSVLFSADPQLLNGFSLTKEKPLDSVITNPLDCSLSRQTRSASVTIPALMHGINFFPGNRSGMYKIIVTLGLVPDLHYDGNQYAPSAAYVKGNMVASAATTWYPVKTKSAESTLTLSLPYNPPDNSFALILSAGICFGIMTGTDDVSVLRAAGSAMILKMA